MSFVISNDCTTCRACVDECPVEAIQEEEIFEIDAEICTDCAACVEVCPVDAISQG